eukprot:9815826-Karenia_brevis.AAC.1
MAQGEFGTFLFARGFDFICSGAWAALNLCLALMILEMAGTPLTWSKVSGGFEYEWIGYRQDLQRFQVGISSSRTAWLQRWALQLLQIP